MGCEYVCGEEECMEEKVYWIWSVLLIFEEFLVVCILDMFLYVSNGVYVDGVMVVKKFIFYVDIFFCFVDWFDVIMFSDVDFKCKKNFFGVF